MLMFIYHDLFQSDCQDTKLILGRGNEEYSFFKHQNELAITLTLEYVCKIYYKLIEGDHLQGIRDQLGQCSSVQLELVWFEMNSSPTFLSYLILLHHLLYLISNLDISNLSIYSTKQVQVLFFSSSNSMNTHKNRFSIVWQHFKINYILRDILARSLNYSYIVLYRVLRI